MLAYDSGTITRLYSMKGEEDHASSVVCRRVMEPGLLNSPPIPASLILGDRVVSTGTLRIEESKQTGLYWPATPIPPGTPLLGAGLKVSGRPQPILLDYFRRCVSDPEHYHFRMLMLT